MLYTRFLQLISKSIAKALSVGFFLLFTFISSGTAHALSTDRDQPAEIEADDIEFDFKNGTRTYINNVLVIQGTLRVKADKVIANYGEEDLENATAWGSLARFKQRPDGKTEDTEGWAKKIIVDQVKNTITLIGKAALKQGPNTARGDTIVYNMATDKMRISGGSKIQAAGKNGRLQRKHRLRRQPQPQLLKQRLLQMLRQPPQPVPQLATEPQLLPQLRQLLKHPLRQSRHQ